MTTEKSILGIDIGSVMIGLAEVNVDGRVGRTGYVAHRGRVDETLRQVLADFDTAATAGIAATSSAPHWLSALALYDHRLAMIEAARRRHRPLGTLLTIGGERFGLIRFDADGNYLDSKSNSPCAAGTGSFLDDQARNLGLVDSAELATAASATADAFPKIASRCAVFAKTDVTHAQQQGYSRAAICDGLCYGLATTVVDTLFSGEPVQAPIVLAGGVARNAAVVRHLRTLIGSDLAIDELAHLYGAIGAALLQHAERARSTTRGAMASHSVEPVAPREIPHDLCYPPLNLDLPDYPAFENEQRYLFVPHAVNNAVAVEVEVDCYRHPGARSSLRAWLGIDIGSTSTKAVLLDADRTMVAGFYTRTTGRPLTAVQGLFESIGDWARREQVALDIEAAATTGAGRKFIAAIVGAELVVDEITAHARAAIELDPQTDTIIEIGGQDAKFTTLQDGAVTSSVMNTVCAAGTGSFIEEQARRLDCPLDQIERRVAGVGSPLVSDRCTVFMQRDINHLIANGFSVDQTLAAVLHAVRENYLRKVAVEARIGQHVCFQGATAKNRALVAAFAQKLGRPIRVSRYCHLTGALGAGLLCAEGRVAAERRFKGLGLLTAQVEMRHETCELCANRCQLSIAEIGGEVAAYGFMCGRDYTDGRYVSNNRSGFDLLKARRKVLGPPSPVELRGHVKIGLGAGIHFAEETDRWRTFFTELGVTTVAPSARTAVISSGKRLARAEFCAPMAAFHGQIQELAERADYIFLPQTFESIEREKDVRRQYCYYQQFAIPLIADLDHGALAPKLILPALTPGLASLQTKLNLLTALRPALGDDLGFSEVSTAFNKATEAHQALRTNLRQLMARERADLDDVAVVLIGRPYTVLQPNMNKGIPDIFASLGVKTFFQDMLDYQRADVEEIGDLLRAVHWHYAAKVLEAAVVVARSPNLYPVFVTSFKCAPDSCIVDYFRRILEGHNKPYLILQLDEHESAVGYETRVESAVRAFRNHRQRVQLPAPQPVAPVTTPLAAAIDGKTLFVPCWDRLACTLLVANLQREGIDARLLREDESTIQRALARNVGQCIPLNVIAQSFVDTVRQQDLDPERCLLWVARSAIACHIGMYPQALQTLIASYGGSFDQANIYRGELSMLDISLRSAANAYFCYMFGGWLRRLACAIRPYEQVAGATDRAVERSLALLETTFRYDRDKLDAVKRVVALFEQIPQQRQPRPQVAIFGDLYVRDNEVMNQARVRTIEDNGGEVITTPYNEYAKIIANLYFRRWLREGKYLDVIKNRPLLATMEFLEKKYADEFSRLVPVSVHAETEQSTEAILERFKICPQHTGESLDNLLKIFHLLDANPEIALFVQASPAFCCPSLITEAMATQIERLTGVPIVNVTYDGTSAPKNDVVIPYLKLPRRGRPINEAAIEIQ